MGVFVATVLRDLHAYRRRPADIINPLVFFLIVLSLFPLGIGPATETLSLVAPGLLWVAALLATLMSMDLMFRSDYEDGSLEQMMLSDTPLLVMVLARITSHWLVTAVPLILLIPLVALMFFGVNAIDGGSLAARGMMVMALAVLLVSPALSLVGSVIAALTVGLPGGGLLVAILVLPLYVPLLIPATAMVVTGVAGGDYTGYVYWLIAILCLALALGPVACTAAIRISLEH